MFIVQRYNSYDSTYKSPQNSCDSSSDGVRWAVAVGGRVLIINIDKSRSEQIQSQAALYNFLIYVYYKNVEECQDNCFIWKTLNFCIKNSDMNSSHMHVSYVSVLKLELTIVHFYRIVLLQDQLQKKKKNR